MIGPYDILLVVVVSAQVVVLTYLYAPKWKAFITTLPIPFTCATLALGHQIDATNVVAMVLFLGYTHGVRILHQRLRLPIVSAIAICALSYCIIGWNVAWWMPSGSLAFWLACAGVGVLATFVLMKHPHRDEPGHRTSLPVWVKLPIIVAIVLGLVLIKNHLRGFMTVFPAVSIFAAYEARHSLWTMSRQVPIFMLTMIPLMVVSRLMYDKVGLPASLALGWLALLSVLLPVTRFMWAAQRKERDHVIA